MLTAIWLSGKSYLRILDSHSDCMNQWFVKGGWKLMSVFGGISFPFQPLVLVRATYVIPRAPSYARLLYVLAPSTC